MQQPQSPQLVRPAGPQNPGRYPFTGPNYSLYGEQPGYVYNPYDDQYYIDKQTYEEHLYDTGQAERPEDPPSAGESLAYGAGAVAAAAAAQQLGTAAAGYLTGSSAAAGAGAGAAAGSGAATGATAATTGTAATGGGVAAGGAGAGGGSAAGGGAAAGAGVSAGTVAATGGIALGLYGAYKGYKQYQALKGEGISPGDYTQSEYESVFLPDLFGEQEWDKDLPDVPLFNRGPVEWHADHAPIGGKYTPSGMLFRSLFSSGKNENQVYRDRIRDHLEESSPIVERIEGVHHIQLADGSMYNIGRDGQSSFKGLDGQDVKHGYEADWSNPLTGYAAGTLNPLIAIMLGENSNAFENQLINAAVSNAQSAQDVLQNIRHFYGSFGYGDKQAAYAEVNKLVEEGVITRDEASAYQNALNQVFDADFEATEDDIPPLPGDHRPPEQPPAQNLKNKDEQVIKLRGNNLSTAPQPPQQQTRSATMPPSSNAAAEAQAMSQGVPGGQVQPMPRPTPSSIGPSAPGQGSQQPPAPQGQPQQQGAYFGPKQPYQPGPDPRDAPTFIANPYQERPGMLATPEQIEENRRRLEWMRRQGNPNASPGPSYIANPYNPSARGMLG